jgi:hypothetical protein
MIFVFISFVAALFALVVSYKTLKMLFTQDWFLGWLKGTVGLFFLALGAGAGLLAYDVYSYKQVLVAQPVATINFEEIDPHHFDAVIVDKNGHQQRFKLHGDQWQLDVRMIKFVGGLAEFDIKPAYRLDRLSGRYFDIHKETSQKRVPFSVQASFLGVDAWLFISNNANRFSFVDATYGIAKYHPMKNGALYEVSLSNSGVGVRPLNDIATHALSEWK